MSFFEDDVLTLTTLKTCVGGYLGHWARDAPRSHYDRRQSLENQMFGVFSYFIKYD